MIYCQSPNKLRAYRNKFVNIKIIEVVSLRYKGGSPSVVVKVVCLESQRSRVRAPLWPSSFKDTKYLFPAYSQIFNIVGSLCDREVAFLASDCQASNFKSCVWSAVSSLRGQHIKFIPIFVLLTSHFMFKTYQQDQGIHKSWCG